MHGRAHEYRRRLDLRLRGIETRLGQELVLEPQRDAASVAIDGEARAVALARRLEQRHALEERAVVAGRLQADVGEPLGDVGRGHAVAAGAGFAALHRVVRQRSEEHTSELQSLMRISYAVFCFKK